jgi:hypothetical protein
MKIETILSDDKKQDRRAALRDTNMSIRQPTTNGSTTTLIPFMSLSSYPFALVSFVRFKSSVRQQYQLATVA